MFRHGVLGGRGGCSVVENAGTGCQNAKIRPKAVVGQILVYEQGRQKFDFVASWRVARGSRSGHPRLSRLPRVA